MSDRWGGAFLLTSIICEILKLPEFTWISGRYSHCLANSEIQNWLFAEIKFRKFIKSRTILVLILLKTLSRNF